MSRRDDGVPVYPRNLRNNGLDGDYWGTNKRNENTAEYGGKLLTIMGFATALVVISFLFFWTGVAFFLTLIGVALWLLSPIIAFIWHSYDAITMKEYKRSMAAKEANEEKPKYDGVKKRCADFRGM